MFRMKNTASSPLTFIPSDRILWCMTMNFLSGSCPHLLSVSKKHSRLTFTPSMIAPCLAVMCIHEYPRDSTSSQKLDCVTKRMICLVDLAAMRILSSGCSSMVCSKLSQSVNLASPVGRFLTTTLGGRI